MGAEMDCAWCHSSPCECPPDSGRNAYRHRYPPGGSVTFGPMQQGHCRGPIDKTEEYDMREKSIAPNPRTGEGDARCWPSQDEVGITFGETPNEVLEAPMIGSKDTNPKDAVGIKKWRQFTTVPFTVLWELGVAMLEGARKYGRHNYRVAGVRGSVYIDAAKGHLDCWWEGEDIDPDSGLSHIVKAIASLVVLRDAMMQDKFLDDRPPKTKNLDKVKADLQAVVERIFEDIPEAKPAFLEGDQYKE